MGSPTQRSMKYLRDQGYAVAIVERYIPTKPRPTKVDLWGLFDLEAVSAPDANGHRHTLYVQTTTASNVSARLKKIRASELMPILRGVPTSRFVVHGWRAPTATRRIWTVREVVL